MRLTLTHVHTGTTRPGHTGRRSFRKEKERQRNPRRFQLGDWARRCQRVDGSPTILTLDNKLLQLSLRKQAGLSECVCEPGHIGATQLSNPLQKRSTFPSLFYIPFASQDPIQSNPIQSMARGAFIVIEGLDRSGKTTQTENLTKYLSTNGITIKQRKFPGERSLEK